MMEVTRTSTLSGVQRTFMLNITQEQIEKYAGGALIQHAFPNLTPDEREFVLTGITQEEWDEIFPEEN